MAQPATATQQPASEAEAPQQSGGQAQQQQQQAQPQNNQAEAIKFIKEKLQSSFDEQNARKLFEFYALDKNTEKLQPPDVRKLLLDILSSSEWPLVVPDEALDSVLTELCLNDQGSISWIEFKSFFVFLQDRPLIKLFDIITKFFTQKQILYSRLVNIKPIRSQPLKSDSQEGNNENENVNINANENDERKINDEERKQSYYDRNKWKAAVSNLIPDAKQIFIYFMDGYQILGLAIGDFESVLNEPAAAEVQLNESMYLATIRSFNVDNDMFPPIARSGGMKSKVARRIADSYIIARQWDEKNLKLIEKTANAANTVSIKWKEIDEKYKVNERVNATTTSIINSVKAFDEKHQLSRRLSNSAKQLDEKFGISQKFTSVADKISSNEKVQIVSTKVNQGFQAAVKTIDDIGQETQQLVQEKQQHQSSQNNGNNGNGNGNEEEQGGDDVVGQQEYGGNDDAVQVESQ